MRRRIARLANTVVYSQPTLRAEAAALLRNRRGQSGLWGYAISGDLPIVLLQIGNAASIELVRQMVQAHAWWRLKGLAVDLVIWNEERDVYRQRLQEQILGLIASQPRIACDRPAGRHLRAPCRAHRARGPRAAAGRGARRHQRPPRQPRATGDASSAWRERRPPPLQPARAAVSPRLQRRHRPIRAALTQFNGIGGFSPDGREYVIAVRCRASSAGAVGQRDRQPALRHRRLRSRQRLHVVRERARAAPDAVAQRSGRRHRRRGDLPARRGERPGLVADVAAARAPIRATKRGDAVPRPATASATACSSTTRLGCTAS